MSVKYRGQKMNGPMALHRILQFPKRDTRMRLRDELDNIPPPVACYLSLTPHLGLKATVFLSQLAYWTGKGKGKYGPEWIYKSRAEIQTETGLTFKEQRAARETLRELGLVCEYHARLEHRIYFRIDLPRLAKWWIRIQQPTEAVDKRALAS